MLPYVGSLRPFKRCWHRRERGVFEVILALLRGALPGRPQARLNADLAATFAGDGDDRGPRRDATP